MNRECFSYDNFSKISKFLKKFNLKSFTNENKLKSYINFFELSSLIEKKLPQDKLKIKYPKYLTQVKNEKKPLAPELHDLCRLHWLVYREEFLYWNLDQLLNYFYCRCQTY